MNPLQLLRTAKHEVYLGARNLKRSAQATKDKWWSFRVSRTEYKFNLARHTSHFGDGALKIPASSTFPVNHLMYDSALPIEDFPKPAPRRVFVFWTGTNEMSENRLKSLERLQKGSTADVILVSPANLDDWIVPSYPLHSAYENLSLIHRSDYLRAYFAYHHGGGYADLKPIEGNLGELIDKINSSSSLWGGGMKELGSHNVGSALGGKLPREQRANFSRHVCASCFAFRPKNPFTGEWLSEVERRLNYFEPLLGQHPPTNPFGTNEGYPIPWFSILGNVFGPLCLKYQQRLIIDENLHWESAPEHEYR